jgi:glycosyltransferase involved in cell wall biosynthesis
MKIGLAIETDSPGGAETMILALARELQARGHELVSFGLVGGPGWLTGQFRSLGIERVLTDPSGLWGFCAARRLVSAIRIHDLDVLHSHEFFFAVWGALAARLGGCRHVITMHGGDYYAGSRRRVIALRTAVAISHRTVAVSQASRSSLVASLRVSPKCVDVVHNGLGVVCGDGVRVRDELGIRPDGTLIVAVGNLYEVKGYVSLLQAVATLRGSYPDLVVAIAGTGYMEPALRALATNLGLESNVKLLGYRADIPDLLDAADLYVMPSLSEGLPMAMIEAMLAGKAIVASDVGGIPELLESSEHGSLVQPGDASELAARISELIDDPVRRKRMGETARQRAAEKFTASAMVDSYEALYRG